MTWVWTSTKSSDWLEASVAKTYWKLSISPSTQLNDLNCEIIFFCIEFEYFDNVSKHFSHENQISTKARVEKGTISHAQLIESLPDDQAKEIDYVARDLAKASSYLLNMYCKNSNISNKDCVKFMSKYSPPETSRLAKKCQETKSKYSSYRRILPASYKDVIQKPRVASSGKDLPLPRVISNVLFTSGLEFVQRLNEHKTKPVSNEGVLSEKLSLSLAQWTQFIEHDLSKSVAQSMSKFHFSLIDRSCWVMNDF